MTIPQKRRIRLIDPRFQFGLVGGFLLLQLLITGLFAYTLEIFFSSELSANLASAHAKVQNLADLLLPIILLTGASSFLVSVVLTTVLVVRMSHHLAGPLFRFRVVLEALAHRVVPAHAAIRPQDQLQEVGTSLGAAVGVLSEDLKALRHLGDAARRSLEEGAPEEAARHLEALEARLAAWTLEA